MNNKLIRIYIFTHLLIHTFTAFIYPLFEEKNIFANTAGLCNANAAADDNVVSVYYNPAGLFKIPKASFYFSNTKLYGIDELLNNTICFSAGVKHLGKIGLLYNNFGFDLYKENLIKFVYANSIKERISFGIGVNSLSVDIKNYRSKSFPSIDLGVLAEVDNKVLLGFYIKNFDLPKIADDEIVSQTIVVGSKITPVKDVSTYIDVVKNTEQDVFAKIAEEVSLNIIKNFITIFRCGVETATKYKPAKYAVGLGLGYKIGSSEIIIDYSYLLSTVLGGQHLVSLNINFGKKEKIFFEEKQEISGTKKRKTELPSKPININTATAQELAQLPGIGPSTAQKIVEYRQQIGKFKSIEQLLDVPRVGTLTLQRITPYITLGEEEKPSPVSLPAVVQPEKIIEEKQKFNLNTITEEELVNLGFSSTAAKNVIRYRIKVGKFISVDELYKIPYVDHSVVDKIKEKLYVE
jgi:competence protein ComEA